MAGIVRVTVDQRRSRREDIEFLAIDLSLRLSGISCGMAWLWLAWPPACLNLNQPRRL